jgi:tripartite-type tricarboxylate transporter receptor subunit TctC
MPGLLVESWTAMMVPASTPDAIVDKLGAEALKIMAAPEIAERATTQGFRVDARGPKDFATFLKSEVDRWGKVIVAAKISAE